MNPMSATIARTLAHRACLTVQTTQAPQFLDITQEVEKAVAASGVKEGIALVFSAHTTAAIRVNENEPLLLQDMEEFLKRVAPSNLYYRHNDFAIRTANMTPDECPNAHAHCQQLLLGVSEAIPIAEGKLLLGQWQRIFLVELDRPRERQVWVQVLGSG